MYFEQIEVGPMQNYIYLIGDPATKEAAVIDPAFEVDRIINIAGTNGYKIKYILLTHTHFDHIDGVPELMKKTGAEVLVHKLESESLKTKGIEITTIVEDGDVFKIGDIQIKILHTPGHTPGGISFVLDDRVITGDALFVGFIGRADLPGSDLDQFYHSLFEKLVNLPEQTYVYPGHNYGKAPFSTIKQEKETNPYLQAKSREEFIELRSNGF
jgi:hydroxyacylglutathione hydrolase